MYKALGKICLGLMLGLTAVMPEQTAVATQLERVLTVEALGEASGGRTQTLEALERMALDDARRRALEQAGAAISSSTTVENRVLSHDEIRTFAEGLVKVLEIRDKQIKFDEASQTFYVRINIRAEVQSLDASELLSRLQSTRQSEGGQKENLGFGFSLIAWQPVMGGSQARGIRLKPASSTSYQRVELRDGGELSSGTEFQIHVTPQQDAYFYLLNIDAQGLLYPLLPHPQGRSEAFLKAGQTYVLPGLNQFYELDEAVGTEKIYLLAANKRQQDIEYLIQRSLQQPEGQQLAAMLAASMQMRRSGKTIPGQQQNYRVSDQISVPLLEELVQGQTHALRVFSFKHK